MEFNRKDLRILQEALFVALNSQEEFENENKFLELYNKIVQELV